MLNKFFENKKRLVIIAGAIVIIAIAIAVICSLCLNPKDPNPEPSIPEGTVPEGTVPGDVSPEEAYKLKLDEFLQVIADPEDADALYDGLQSVRDAALEFGDEALDKIGFVLDDVNKDGKEELFVGCFDNEDPSDVNNEIYAAFTYDGDNLTPLFEKQKQNTFALTDAGTVYFYGTDGAQYYILAEYALDENGKLICKDFYFTYPKDGNGIGYYHNTTGVWDPEGSEEIQMTPEEFEEMRKELAGKTVPLEDVKFSEVGKQ